MYLLPFLVYGEGVGGWGNGWEEAEIDLSLPEPFPSHSSSSCVMRRGYGV